MRNLTASDFEELLYEEFNATDLRYALGELEDRLFCEAGQSTSLTFGDVECVMDKRDDDFWIRVYRVNGDQYFKFAAPYDSWEGQHWDAAGIFEVKPVEKVVIDYEHI